MRTLLSTSTVALLFFCGCAQGQSGEAEKLFQERYRPQFHYTMTKGWINDPIGLFYYEGSIISSTTIIPFRPIFLAERQKVSSRIGLMRLVLISFIGSTCP